MLKRSLTDSIKLRIIVLLERWKKQTEVVQDDIESYLQGYNISKIKISKDVLRMKELK